VHTAQIHKSKFHSVLLFQLWRIQTVSIGVPVNIECECELLAAILCHEKRDYRELCRIGGTESTQKKTKKKDEVLVAGSI
jgi:hypothetical protein